jgi:membrane associated rhomboid family serine protease
MTAGIAPIVSGPVGGWIYGAFGGAALFATCAAVLGMAAGLAYVVLAPLAAARKALAASRPAPATDPGPAEP